MYVIAVKSIFIHREENGEVCDYRPIDCENYHIGNWCHWLMLSHNICLSSIISDQQKMNINSYFFLKKKLNPNPNDSF